MRRRGFVGVSVALLEVGFAGSYVLKPHPVVETSFCCL